MTRPRSKSITQNSQMDFRKKFKKASHTTKRRLSPIKEGKNEDRSGSTTSSKKSSQKELIIVSRQKTLKQPQLQSSKVSKKNKKTSFIKSIKSLFKF
jgi:hypothetical protein